MTFECSTAARDRGDDPAGTASTVRAFLLIEHDGAWGTDALRDARLPNGVGRTLAARCADAGVRPLLIRRGERRPTDRAGYRVFAAHTDSAHPRLETTEVDDPRELLHTDVSMLRQVGSLGWQPVTEPLFAVCTHGKHDRCCAVRGRPVAAALRAAEPDAGWKTEFQFSTERDDIFVNQANIFMDAMEGKGKFACTLEEGLQTLRVNLTNLQVADNPAWHSLYYTFDNSDRVLTETDALGRVTQHHYDERGDVLYLNVGKPRSEASGVETPADRLPVLVDTSALKERGVGAFLPTPWNRT